MRDRHVIGGVGGIAAAAAVVLVGMWLAPGSTPVGPQRADALSRAMRTFDSIDALVIDCEWSTADGAPADGWRGSVLRDAGMRFESRDGRLEIYNRAEQKGYRISPTGTEVLRRSIRDDGLIQEFLSRGKLEQSVEFVLISGRQPGAVRDVTFERDGVLIRRLEALDGRARPIAVEIDLARQRLANCESWIDGQGDAPPVRQVLRFEYPNSIDPACFAPPPLEGRNVIDEPASHSQCMVNVRNLCMAIQIYAQEHDDRLPSNLSELAGYAPGGDSADWRHCTDANGEPVAVLYHGPGELGTSTLASLDLAKAVLLTCRLSGGEYLGFADGHVEFHRLDE